jgi:hypothetical protein
MNLWWMLFLLAALLSPLAWLVPSRAQLGAMDVRMQARRLGLSMQLSGQDWPHWFERTVPRSCAQYFLLRKAGNLPQWCYWQVEPGTWLDKWREPCADEYLLEHLRRLPPDAYKVEAGVQLVSVYWGEKGGVQDLPQILDFLRQGV